MQPGPAWNRLINDVDPPVYRWISRGSRAQFFTMTREQQAEVSRVANSSLRFVNIRNLSVRGFLPHTPPPHSPHSPPQTRPSPRVFGKRQVALTDPINPSGFSPLWLNIFSHRGKYFRLPSSSRFNPFVIASTDWNRQYLVVLLPLTSETTSFYFFGGRLFDS